MIRPGERVTIHTAVMQGDLDQVKQMLKDSASVDEVDRQNFTPLHWATNVGAIEILQFLLWKGADPLIVTSRGWTPVHIAAIRGYKSCVQSLADRGISLSAQDKYGLSPGHLAATHGNSACLMALLRSGADVETVDRNGWTMLHCAAYHGRLGCVQILLRYGFRIEDTDKAGNTAAHLAAMEGHLPVLQCLVSQVKTPLYFLDMPNDLGETTSSLAKRYLKDEVTQFIDRYRSNLQERPVGVEEFARIAFPAHAAAYEGDLAHLRVLIDSGVIKIDERDDQGATPLHKAAGQGHIKIIQWLRENGADPGIVNHLGEKPADVAQHYGQVAALDILQPPSSVEQSDEAWLMEALPSDIPFGYVEGEPQPEIVYDRETAIGRARKKIEKLKRLLELAESDYTQLGGEPNPEELRLKEEARESHQQLEECQVQLDYERIRREKLEAKLDVAQREVTKLTARLISVPGSPQPSETNSETIESGPRRGARRVNKPRRPNQQPSVTSDSSKPTNRVLRARRVN